MNSNVTCTAMNTIEGHTNNNFIKQVNCFYFDENEDSFEKYIGNEKKLNIMYYQIRTS